MPAPVLKMKGTESMNARFDFPRRAARAWAAVGTAAVLMGSATWYGLGAHPGAAEPALTPSPSMARAVAGGRDSYADVVDVVAPAVVTVHATGRARVSDTQFQLPEEFFGQRGLPEEFFGQRGINPRRMPRPRQNAMGSGVVVTSDGYILTNNHVVEDADSVSVDFTDGRTMTAKVIGTDKPSDLALLKVEGSDFRSVTLGDSDAVKVGDVVLAVGNPLNVGQTVTMGIISAKGRSTGVGDGSYEDFLQTDAPINHGNSGGALVSTKGELIGINSQILSNSDGNIGIGFAIPANMARRVMTDLRTSGKVSRGQLGITVQTVSSDMAESLGLKQSGGVIVSSVAPGSAAERAGLKRGDVIRSLNGQPVADMNTLRNRVAEAGPGSTVQMVVVRDGAEQHLSARLEALDSRRAARGDSDSDSDQSGEPDKAALGISVAPLTPEVASQLRLPANTKGIVVQNVDPDGRAADAGIRPGDVIQEVNRQPVTSVDTLRTAVRRNTDKPTLLLINRDGADIFVTVKPANG
jgi:Do/DeqQ family serine protease